LGIRKAKLPKPTTNKFQASSIFILTDFKELISVFFVLFLHDYICIEKSETSQDAKQFIEILNFVQSSILQKNEDLEKVKISFNLQITGFN